MCEAGVEAEVEAGAEAMVKAEDVAGAAVSGSWLSPSCHPLVTPAYVGRFNTERQYVLDQLYATRSSMPAPIRMPSFTVATIHPFAWLLTQNLIFSSGSGTPVRRSRSARA